jgi:hypothetical protein
MYAGEQGDRSIEEWYSDAVAGLLNAVQEIELRYTNGQAQDTESQRDTPN